MMKGKKMRTLFYWIKEIMIMFLLTSMVLLTAAIGTAILLNNLQEKIMDHFDTEITCEEYYCNDYDGWLLELEQIQEELLDMVNRELQITTEREYIDV